ncbi:MAG: restriction endonuclease subunit S [Planktothrix sp.]|uniref:restriction endonuclease subunit S n=2 Tax=Planktothrix sp. TaxID=3088171 RepID=UPI0038D3E51B
MSEWKETTLREAVLKANTGADAIQKAPIVNYDSGIRCLRIQDVSNSHDLKKWGFCEITQDNYKRFYLKQGDILIARTGNTIGVNIYIEQDLKAVFNNGLIRLNINKEKFIPKYIYYLFQTYNFKGHINSIAYGTSTQPNMQIESLLSFNFNYPPVNVQEKIVNLFSTLDKKIDNLRSQNETLEKIAQTLFKHWFIDFEFPNDEGKPYKSSGGAMVASELGDIPEGWRVGTIGEIMTLNYGKSLITDNRVNGQYLVVGSSGVVGTHNEYLVKAPGIVIGRKGTIGKVIWLENNFYPIDTTFFVTDKLGCNDLYFHYFILKNQQFERLISDSAVPGLNRDMAYSVEIIIPNISLINNFSLLARSLFNKKANNENQIQTLTKTRDALLPKLMSGQIRVKEVESLIEEVK